MEIIKNKDYELTIEDITLNGEGVGKIDGYALFCKRCDRRRPHYR